jgi:hypothetical protein
MPSKDSVSSLKRAAKNEFTREKIGIGLCILYHKTCYKKLTRCLYKVNENLENI